MELFFEWTATLLSITGALLVSFKIKWAFPVFLLSNVFWIIFALQLHAYGLFFAQIVFVFISINGIRVWFRKPALNEVMTDG